MQSFDEEGNSESEPPSRVDEVGVAESEPESRVDEGRNQNEEEVESGPLSRVDETHVEESDSASTGHEEHIEEIEPLSVSRVDEVRVAESDPESRVDKGHLEESEPPSILDNRDSQLSYVLKEDTDEYLSKRPMKIFIKMHTGNIITVMVYPSTTIGFVKEIIESKDGILASRQRLLYLGKYTQDEKTIADYKIAKESTLHMLPRTGKSYYPEKRSSQHIFIQPVNKRETISLNFEPTVTIAGVKQQIEYRTEIPPKYQLLKFCNELLEDEKTLSQCDIKTASILLLSDCREEEKIREAQIFAEREMKIKLQELEDARLCVVCLDNEKTHLVFPCKHFCLCEKCANSELLQACPMCRKEVRSIERIY